MGLRGSLLELQLPDLIEMMSIGGKTGTITLLAETAERGGEVGFVDGDLVSARCGDFTGERAFFALLSLSRGSFQVDPARRPTGRDIARPTQSLLMEGMRRQDEVRRLRERLPGSAVVIAGASGTAADDLEAVMVALTLERGRQVREFVRVLHAAGHADEYESLLALDRLLARGALVVKPPV